MTNFNPINNINFIKTNLNNLQNNKNVQDFNDNFNASNNLNSYNLPLNKTFEPINPTLIYDFQLVKMDNEVLIKYLQSLLSIPNSIDKFIESLNSKNEDNKILKILVENLIDTKALSEFLNEKSKTAIDKILQTISISLKSGLEENAQLKEILSILTFIQTQSLTNSNMLKEFLLLYIPVNGQIFDRQVEYDIDESDEKEKIKSQDLSIMFETINLSNILCTLSALNEDIFICFYVSNVFPKEKFKKILEEFSKSSNINFSLEFKLKNTISDKNNQIQNFKVISKSYISPTILILSHFIIKIIFKIDNDFSI